MAIYKAGKIKGLLPSSGNPDKVQPQRVSYRLGLHKIKVDEYEIIYAISDMQIEVLDINFNERTQIQNAKNEKPAWRTTLTEEVIRRCNVFSITLNLQPQACSSPQENWLIS